MTTLFPVEPDYPDGFLYLPDFISGEEESGLLNKIARIDLHTFHFQGYEAKRKVASFGYDWNFERRTLSKGKDIPEEFHALIEKIARRLSVSPDSFQELLVTEYPVGSVINWHRDAPPFALIAGLSLRADCIFKMRPHNKAKQNRNTVLSFPVRRRSLYIMDGPARTDWEHSTAAVKEVRYSITLRTLKVPAQSF
jgi:alkylated DNA repair dioxygenase AlkB